MHSREDGDANPGHRMIKPAYQISRDGEGIVVRLSGDVFTRDDVARFLDYLALESIRKRSRLTPADAEMLANEVKRAAWERVRHLFPPRR